MFSICFFVSFLFYDLRYFLYLIRQVTNCNYINQLILIFNSFTEFYRSKNHVFKFHKSFENCTWISISAFFTLPFRCSSLCSRRAGLHGPLLWLLGFPGRKVFFSLDSLGLRFPCWNILNCRNPVWGKKRFLTLWVWDLGTGCYISLTTIVRSCFTA